MEVIIETLWKRCLTTPTKPPAKNINICLSETAYQHKGTRKKCKKTNQAAIIQWQRQCLMDKPHRKPWPKSKISLIRVPVHCIAPFCSDALVSAPNLYPPCSAYSWIHLPFECLQLPNGPLWSWHRWKWWHSTFLLLSYRPCTGRVWQSPPRLLQTVCCPTMHDLIVDVKDTLLRRSVKEGRVNQPLIFSFCLHTWELLYGHLWSTSILGHLQLWFLTTSSLTCSSLCSFW